MRQLQALSVKLEYMKRRWTQVSRSLNDCCLEIEKIIEQPDIEAKDRMLKLLQTQFTEAKIISKVTQKEAKNPSLSKRGVK